MQFDIATINHHHNHIIYNIHRLHKWGSPQVDMDGHVLTHLFTQGCIKDQHYNNVGFHIFCLEWFSPNFIPKCTQRP